MSAPLLLFRGFSCLHLNVYLLLLLQRARSWGHSLLGNKQTNYRFLKPQSTLWSLFDRLKTTKRARNKGRFEKKCRCVSEDLPLGEYQGPLPLWGEGSRAHGRCYKLAGVAGALCALVPLLGSGLGQKEATWVGLI